MTNLKTTNNAPVGDSNVVGILEDENKLCLLGVSSGVPTASAAGFAKGCIVEDEATGATYTNTGTSTAAIWTLGGTVTAGSVDTTELADGAVTLAKLDDGIAPSHVVKFAGKITWSGSGASLATTITGVEATDIVLCTIQDAPTEDAYIASAKPTTDTLTVVLSEANTSNDGVIAYQVLRAAA